MFYLFINVKQLIRTKSFSFSKHYMADVIQTTNQCFNKNVKYMHLQ